MLTLTADEYEVLVRQQVTNHLVEKQLEMLKKVPGTLRGRCKFLLASTCAELL